LRIQLQEKLKKVDRNSISWREAKIRGDPYSELNEGFFHKYSAIKLANINHYMDFVKPSNITTNTGSIVFGDDGGYSEYILWNYFEKTTRASCAIVPEYGIKAIEPREYAKDIVDVEKSLINLKTLIPDLENNFDYYTVPHLEKVCNTMKEQLADQEIMVMVGSKKIKYENELNQELDCAKYMLVYIIAAFKLLAKGGSLVLRTYDHHTPFTCGLMFLLYKHFDQIAVIKPLSSNLHSAERFVIATNLLTDSKSLKKQVDELYEILKAVTDAGHDGKEITSIMDLQIFQNYPDFKTYVLEESARVEEWRIHSLGNLLDLMKHPYKELGGKDEIKDLCLKLWGLPVLKPAEVKAKEREEIKVAEVEKVTKELDEILDIVKSRNQGNKAPQKLDPKKLEAASLKKYADVTAPKPSVKKKMEDEAKKKAEEYIRSIQNKKKHKGSIDKTTPAKNPATAVSVKFGQSNMNEQGTKKVKKEEKSEQLDTKVLLKIPVELVANRKFSDSSENSDNKK